MLTPQYNGIVHLTVSPLVMREIGGCKLARRLLRQHPTMKTLFVSGYDDETIVLQHPYRLSGLIEKVREVFECCVSILAGSGRHVLMKTTSTGPAQKIAPLSV
jgi:hypothetical protein